MEIFKPKHDTSSSPKASSVRPATCPPTCTPICPAPVWSLGPAGCHWLPEVVHKAPVKATAENGENGLLSRETPTNRLPLKATESVLSVSLRTVECRASYDKNTSTHNDVPDSSTPAWGPWEVIGRLQLNDISLLLGPLQL